MGSCDAGPQLLQLRPETCEMAFGYARSQNDSVLRLEAFSDSVGAEHSSQRLQQFLSRGTGCRITDPPEAVHARLHGPHGPLQASRHSDHASPESNDVRYGHMMLARRLDAEFLHGWYARMAGLLGYSTSGSQLTEDMMVPAGLREQRVRKLCRDLHPDAD